jgi:hypothetical protein
VQQVWIPIYDLKLIWLAEGGHIWQSPSRLGKLTLSVRFGYVADTDNSLSVPKRDTLIRDLRKANTPQ